MSATARADQRSSLVHDALDAYLAFAQALHAPMVGAWLRLDLSMVELKALLVVAQGEAPTIGGLAVILHVSRPEASRVADHLYRRRLITRVEDRVDRRRTLLGLTRTGHDLAGALLVGDRTSLAGSLTRLELADLQGLVQGLRALLALPRSTPGPHATQTRVPVALGR
jgi:DNA-binding MarR family transcriptional regulator